MVCLGLSWLVLHVLPCFGRPNPEKTFRSLKSCFLPPASFATSYHAKINFQTLAWWNIWPIALFGMPAPEKTFGDLKVFSSLRLLCNLIPRQNELAKPSPYEPLKNQPIKNLRVSSFIIPIFSTSTEEAQGTSIDE